MSQKVLVIYLQFKFKSFTWWLAHKPTKFFTFIHNCSMLVINLNTVIKYALYSLILRLHYANNKKKRIERLRKTDGRLKTFDATRIMRVFFANVLTSSTRILNKTDVEISVQQ